MSIDEFFVMCDMKNIAKIALVSLSDNIKTQCKKLKIEKFQVKLPGYCKQDACIIDTKTLSSLVPSDINIQNDIISGLVDYYAPQYGVYIVINLSRIADGLKHERDLLMKRVNILNTALTLAGESV